MSRETYEILRWVIHGGTVGLAICSAFLFHKFRRRLSGLEFATLFIAAFVFIKSVVFLYWTPFVQATVPIMDEAMAIGIFHLFVISPLAAIGLLMSIFQPAIRWIGIALSLGFLAFSSIALFSF